MSQVRSVLRSVLRSVFRPSFRVLGVPVEVDPSLVVWWMIWLWTAGVAVLPACALAFASLLAHELGHAAVARRRGVRVLKITMWVLGGSAEMARTPTRPSDEMAIAAAGPLVSLAIAGIGRAIGGAVGSDFVVRLALFNLWLACFNLIPALPMDGGRIARALLARQIGYARATRASVRLARWIAVLFFVLGVASLVAAIMRVPLPWGGLDPWYLVPLVPLAFLLWVFSGQELARLPDETRGYARARLRGRRSARGGSRRRGSTTTGSPSADEARTRPCR
jgi:Zn-dependent protease